MPVVPDHRHDGVSTLHALITLHGTSRTILTRLFGRGLENDHHLVERFQAISTGDIRR